MWFVYSVQSGVVVVVVHKPFTIHAIPPNSTQSIRVVILM